jgi:hypothetical protein
MSLMKATWWRMVVERELVTKQPLPALLGSVPLNPSIAQLD